MARPVAEKAPRRVDLLRVPLVGRFLKWPRSRLVLQALLFVLAVLVMLHGFLGPEVAPKNLATLLTWVHFRGVIVLVLLVLGNFFCMACPFLLPREIARAIVAPRRRLPRALRNKGPAILLFITVLYLYELFDLWGQPFWTAMMILYYFLFALVVDTLFAGAPFCKSFCPVGQFNFLGSTMSPFEVAVRDPGTCGTCTTGDCIRGRYAPAAPGGGAPAAPPLATGGERTEDGAAGRAASPPRRGPLVQRGCELALFQPLKVGNLDCTFCLDCVHACPHDNVGILSRVPGAELAHEGFRSGIGSIERRVDWNILIVVFVFGALLNAFAMVPPVYALELAMAQRLGIAVEWPILGMIFVFALVILPMVLLGITAQLSYGLSGGVLPRAQLIDRFVRCLVPFGFGVWLAHYGFHFLTGALTVIPVTQNAVRILAGWPVLGAPRWDLGGLSAAMTFPIEMAFLAVGLLGSLHVARGIARRVAPEKPGRVLAPWALLLIGLTAVTVLVLTMPMDMRGTFLG